MYQGHGLIVTRNFDMVFNRKNGSQPREAIVGSTNYFVSLCQLIPIYWPFVRFAASWVIAVTILVKLFLIGF